MALGTGSHWIRQATHACTSQWRNCKRLIDAETQRVVLPVVSQAKPTELPETRGCGSHRKCYARRSAVPHRTLFIGAGTQHVTRLHVNNTRRRCVTEPWDAVHVCANTARDAPSVSPAPSPGVTSVCRTFPRFTTLPHPASRSSVDPVVEALCSECCCYTESTAMNWPCVCALQAINDPLIVHRERAGKPAVCPG